MSTVLLGWLVFGGHLMFGTLLLMTMTFIKGKRLNVMLFGEPITGNPFIAERTEADKFGIEVVFIMLWPFFCVCYTAYKAGCFLGCVFEKLANARANAKLPPLNSHIHSTYDVEQIRKDLNR